MLGLPTPGADAPPPFELTQLNAVSNDGRWFLLTSTSDRLVTNDLNASADVFLFDRMTRRATLVSVAPDGRAGNGASLAPAMTPEASRVVFQSRASDLAPKDTNNTWDVFARDLAAGTTFLASVATNGASGALASTDPAVSADGRYVLFSSEAYNLASRTGVVLRALYRRDLLQNKTVWVSQQLTGLGTLPVRTYDAALSPSGQFAAFVAAGSTNQLFLRDIDSAGTLRLTGMSAFDPPGLRNASLYSLWPVLSDDGAFAACRFGLGATNGCLWFDTASSSARAFGLGTNGLPARMPLELLGPALSRDGQFLAYAQPVRVAGKPEPILQIYRGQGSGGTPILVSARQGTAEFSDTHAFAPRITPDGRFVAFLSYASDLASDDCNRMVDLFKVDIVTDPELLMAIRRNLDTGRTELLWNGQPGKTYRLESKDDLPAADWTAMPGEFAGDAPIELDTNASAARFFRVREL
ncbi:MAG TPA: hypothetical protein PKM43_17795 [Verrucomicrobiota bacterium]|nr:hypothetical protein [Verrucomicrobiota bacterium]